LFRALGWSTALVVLIVWTAWDAFGQAKVSPIDAMAEALRRADFPWLAEVSDRLKESGYEMAMVFLFFVALLYVLIQLLAAACDRAASAPSDRSFSWSRRAIGLVRHVSGRPAGFSPFDPALGERARFHFTIGREILFAPIRFSLWLFPVLGFLGTIIGISQAVSKLPSAMNNRGQLDSVLSSLHFAFDTTFLGLVAALALMVGLLILAAMWDRNELSHAGGAAEVTRA
jgi:hypothetical protein